MSVIMTMTLLGIDMGTTACKALLTDSQARIISMGSAAYPLHHPRPGWAEQDVIEVWAGVIRATRQALEQSRLTAPPQATLSLSGTLHSLLPVDRHMAPRANTMIWADTRSAAAAHDLRERTDAAALYHRTGCPIQPMYPLAKLAWLREHMPDGFADAAHFITIKDYIIYRLTGDLCTEPSIASGSGLLALEQRIWDAEALVLAGVKPDRLPDIRNATDRLPLHANAAQALGLDPASELVLGGSDGALANLGAGAITPGCAALTIGTSGAIRFVGQKPRTHPQEHTWCYILPDSSYLIGAAINNGGLVLNWFHEHFGSDEAEQAEAAKLPPGAEGLLFLPFLTGERCPNWNADARGVMFGLSVQHGRAHIVRAIMEGVAFRMYNIFRSLESLEAIHAIHASGGFTNSRLWLQIVADVLGREIKLPDTRQMSAMGAVFVAMAALGLVEHLADTAQLIRVGPGVQPDMHKHAVYRGLFEQVESIYNHVTEDFAALAAQRN